MSAAATGELPVRPGRLGRLDRWVRPEPVFLVLFLVFGAVFVAMVPPGWNSDEPNHTFRAAAIADLDLLPEVWTDPDGTRHSGGEVPTELIRVFQLTQALNATVFDRTAKVDSAVQDSDGDVLGGADFSPRQLSDFRNTAIYSPVAYLPQLPAVWIGRALGLSWFSIVVLARVFALLAVGAATLLAIRWTPRGKWVFAAVGVLPAFVAQSAALGADATVLGLSVLLVAAVLRAVARPEPVRARTWVLLVVLAALLGLTKVPYAAAAALLLTVPLCRRDQPAVRRWGIGVAATVVAVLPAAAWNLVTAGAAIPVVAGADAGRQLENVLAAPVGYLKVLYRTFLTDDPARAWQSMFGEFVWGTTPLPTGYVLLAVAVLTLAVFTTDDREEFGLPDRAALVGWRVWWILVAGGLVVVAATAVYLNFSAIGIGYVEGYQGRYTLPSLVLVMLALTGNVLRSQRVARLSIAGTALVVLLGSVVALHSRLG
jgi:uncharacterized membrane protein